MRTLLLLSSVLVAISLRQVPLQPEDLPVKKASGAENRYCRTRGKTRTADEWAVIGGTLVNSPADFPFLAWIGDNDGTGMAQFCGGTLIDELFVLTAGHCLYSEESKNANIYVRFNLTNYQTTRGIVRGVKGWKRHSAFSPITLYEDLTILMLNESIPEELIQPVKLSDGTKDYEKSGTKTIVGWGSTDEGCTMYDTLLRKATVPLGTYGPECTSSGSKTLTIAHDFDFERQLCAGDYAGTMHYPGCGDSGGPLLAQVGTSWVQVGMVSWSYGVPYPDVFTRVSNYIGWIETTKQSLRF